ncbi:hypothetical protein, unlikely [Trypanosoma brucei gambiense DAL972]|uniref:Uncharacterized protein n=1 Tax=Trypanosoma brucei gambiense (strain MHOM/CI/86/DAL972) TaxID=679716 RepID=C9ZPM2_TRYB9|nr:hypothetical protein, unlikely [Trypanosoma brucei gambiense DAL972]CBH11350.1 hypothetical protein, unlikely [Trypanosoma brucei gambiense DAL972]|eukprot:XP_011773637.1 hypothetical protein, unlikely [Trypanosoma brucei gambiense DAL972]
MHVKTLSPSKELQKRIITHARTHTQLTRGNRGEETPYRRWLRRGKTRYMKNEGGHKTLRGNTLPTRRCYTRQKGKYVGANCGNERVCIPSAQAVVGEIRFERYHHVWRSSVFN